jgi:hypothetical protein
VRSAETAVASDQGGACLYELPGNDIVKSAVAIEVMPDEQGVLQASLGGMGNVEEEFRSAERKGDTLVANRWDFLANMPGGLVAAKRGRIAVEMVTAMAMSDRALTLASAIVDSIPDLPFADDPADASVPPTGIDPCALITRQEAEAAMGPLVTAPFRSRKSSALAYGSGASCTYYTGKHRALVITPTLRHGADLFRMLGGANTMVQSKVGGASAPDTLDGPWEQTATSANGSLNLLKGDKMLSMQYKTSNANYEAAIKLARAAIPRL